MQKALFNPNEHAPTLEANAKALAARVLAFLATSRGLAPAGSGAAADAPRLAVRAGGGPEVVQLHQLPLWSFLFERDRQIL